MIRVLVTASRLRLAKLLEKGLQLQGWNTCVATTYNAVIEKVKHTSIDLVLVDADFFQAETLPLLAVLQQQRLPLIVIAKDYQVGGHDLRQATAAEDIFIKPFSTKHLITVLSQKITLEEY
ncbi:hypothetical protein U2F10_25030 [Leptothoe sp. EHU-05/26/07-4]